MADNIQVRDASGTLLTMRTTDTAGVHTPHQRVMGYDEADDMLKIKSVQKKFRDSFPGSSLDTTKWESSIGSGGSITVTGGTLVMASGTTASAETSVLSKDTFTVPFRVGFNLTLSQRIANQTFLVEAVSVNATTGVPDGLHSTAWLFDGATATQAKYRVQNSGVTPLDSAASTVVTTAGTGVYEIEPFADECWFHSSTLDATSGRANSYRRHQQIPDPNAVYKIRLRWLNGATPPATTTNATLQYVACQDYAELTAEITAGRGQSVAGQALAVAVTTMPTTAVSQSGTWTVQPGNTANTTPWLVSGRNNIFWNDSTTPLGAAGSFTGASRDVGIAAGSAQPYAAFNAAAFADQAGTLRIEMSNDNTTWRRATADTAVAASAVVYLSVPVMTRYYRAVYVNGATLQAAFMLNTSFTEA